MSQQRNGINRSALWSLSVLNTVFGVGLCVIHTRAENATETIGDEAEYPAGAWDRIASGPFHWSTMDKILFSALILLALEILKLLCSHSGGA